MRTTENRKKLVRFQLWLRPYGVMDSARCFYLLSPGSIPGGGAQRKVGVMRRRQINSLGNDYGYAFVSGNLVYSKRNKAKVRKAWKRATHKAERRLPLVDQD